MQISPDDPRRPAVAALLAEHLADMRAFSPPESVHALEPQDLAAPGITFWSAHAEQELLGCAALRELDPSQGEIKSMRTARAHLRRGVASRLLEHLLEVARQRGYRRLSLETGSQPEFAPARALYARYGFRECGPFGDYGPDPNSCFMTLELG